MAITVLAKRMYSFEGCGTPLPELTVIINVCGGEVVFVLSVTVTFKVNGLPAVLVAVPLSRPLELNVSHDGSPVAVHW